MDGVSPRWDFLFRDAWVFDGTGAMPVRQDVAVADGRIARVGLNLDPAQAGELVDVAGRWLIPGMLDIHTHFDLEVELEPGLPEAVRHGTTTVVVSNCSLGLAFGAQRRGGAEPIVDCFARVENVPKHVLRRVADRVDWSDSRAYLEHLGRLPLGPNIAPMIPHSMLRIEVMGLHDSVRRAPSAAELRRMGELLDKGMREGYVGFSTDALPFHYLASDPNRRRRIPAQFASYAELKYLTGIVRRWGRVWQATPPKDDKRAVFRNFLLTSGRLFGRTLKVTAVAAIDLATNRSILRLGLLLSRLLNSRLLRGHFRLQALSAPFKVWADGPFTPIAEEIPVLRRLNETDLEDREARQRVLHDPAWVAAFRRMWFKGRRGFGLARLKRWLRLDGNVLTRELRDMTIDQSPVAAWRGQTMQAVYERLLAWQNTGRGAADEQEAAAFARFPKIVTDDAAFFLHLLREYDTRLRWWTTTANRDPAVVERLLFHPQVLPGFNDSGAHLTNMAFYDGNLRTLKLAQLGGLQRVAQAVRRLTQEPAEFFGLDAGALRTGARADLAVIDPEALLRYQPEAAVRYVWRDIFSHHQLVNRPEGVVGLVMVGGRIAWRDGRFAEAFGIERMGSPLRHRDHAEPAAAPSLAAAA